MIIYVVRPQLLYLDHCEENKIMLCVYVIKLSIIMRFIYYFHKHD